jgi:hypothetical protein
LIFAGGPLFLSIVPWLSWFTALFSIPIAIFDLWAGVSLISTLYGLGVGALFLIHIYTIPFFVFLAVFGEIILIPLAIFSPFLFLGGLIGWIYGDLQGQ